MTLTGTVTARQWLDDFARTSESGVAAQTVANGGPRHFQSTEHFQVTREER